MGLRASIAGWAGLIVRLFGVFLLVTSAMNYYVTPTLYGMETFGVGIIGMVLIVAGGGVRNVIAKFLLVRDSDA